MPRTKIEWTGRTWNPITGCTKVSPGCTHCYAETMSKRLKAMGQPKYENGFDLTLHEDVLEAPLSWKKPAMVFVNSMSDLFHPDVPFSFIFKVWKIMYKANHHTFQILTKRPERLKEFGEMLDERGPFVRPEHGEPSSVRLPNVWLGTSVENQAWVNKRVPHLLATPAAVRFLSIEPMLERVIHLRTVPNGPNVDWVIAGGESGPGARPCKIEWLRYLVDHCTKTVGIPIFVKQLGTHLAKELHLKDRKGANWDEWPPELADLKIRQFPEVSDV